MPMEHFGVAEALGLPPPPQATAETTTIAARKTLRQFRAIPCTSIFSVGKRLPERMVPSQTGHLQGLGKAEGFITSVTVSVAIS
jgi:hypothetical protein